MPAILRWWVRLHWSAWRDAVRTSPFMHGLLALPGWIIPVVAVVFAFDARIAGFPVRFLLSLDVPLTLAMAAGVLRDVRLAGTAAAREEWLWPASHRPVALRHLARLHHLLLLLRWPLLLALLAVVASAGGAIAADERDELLLMSLLALATGLALHWMLASRADRGGSPSRPRRARGLRALSWASVHETLDAFAMRRIALLAMPAMLAAPMGAQAGQVLGMVLLLVGGMGVVTLLGECLRILPALLRWMPEASLSRLVLALHVWRHAAALVFVLLGVALLWQAGILR